MPKHAEIIKKRRKLRRRLAPKKKAGRTKRRARWPWVLVVLAAALALYAYDYRGPLETIRGEVMSTRSYPHETPTEPPHTHIEAVVEAEGRRFTAREADGVEVGQAVTVVVSRGRLTGRVRFEALGPVSGAR